MAPAQVAAYLAATGVNHACFKIRVGTVVYCCLHQTGRRGARRKSSFCSTTYSAYASPNGTFADVPAVSMYGKTSIAEQLALGSGCRLQDSTMSEKTFEITACGFVGTYIRVDLIFGLSFVLL